MNADILNLLLGVLASLIAAVIVIVLTYIWSRALRDAVYMAMRQLHGLELEETYLNRDAAKEFLEREWAWSREVRVFSSRLTDLQGSTSFSRLFRDIANRGAKVQILLPEPYPAAQLFDWTEYRNTECRRFDPNMVPGQLASQIADSLKYIRSSPIETRPELATSNIPHLCRLIVTERSAYFTPYSDDRHGDQNVVYRFLAGTTMYAWLKRVFEHMWESALWYRENPASRRPELISQTDNVEALIFDCDGTLADSMGLHFEALSNVMSEIDVKIRREQFDSQGGKPTKEIIKDILTKLGREASNAEIESLARKKEDLFIKSIDRLKPIQWVVDVARKNRGHRKLAVASGATREVLERQLQQLKISDLFEILIAADDVLDPKPAADTFLQAAERLDVRVERCVVYEDSDHGIEAARNAKMRWIDIRGMSAGGLRR